MEALSNIQTSGYIADQIRILVFNGTYKDGQELTQNDVANALCLSRMPVREAFQQLVQEGILTRLANRHVKINGMNKKRIREIIGMFRAMQLWLLANAPSCSIEAEDELSWHNALGFSMDNPYLGSAIQSFVSGFLSFFFSGYPQQERMDILKRISVLLSEDDKASACELMEEYFNLLESEIMGKVSYE